MNTTIRCTAMASLQLYAITYTVFIFLMTLILFFGIITYTEAILNEIKSFFNQIDHVSKFNDKNKEIAMLQHCKEAIDLHVRLNRYFDSIAIFNEHQTILLAIWQQRTPTELVEFEVEKRNIKCNLLFFCRCDSGPKNAVVLWLGAMPRPNIILQKSEALSKYDDILPLRHTFFLS